MKKFTFTESQILAPLRQCKSCSAEDVSKEHDISLTKIGQGRKKCAGTGRTYMRRIKELQEENRRLKEMFAEVSLDYKIVKEIIKNW